MNDRHILRCDVDTCQKIVAKIHDGTLRIVVRHNKSWHPTTLTIRQMERILEQMRESEREAA